MISASIPKMTNRQRNLMMVVLLFGAFVALLAETFLNNALPTIMHAFSVSQATAQWLTTAYLLVVGLMIPMSAWIFNSFSLKVNYLTMMAIFFSGSVVCALAVGYHWGFILMISFVLVGLVLSFFLPTAKEEHK
ncbi:MFS transporter [Lactobacillus xylocopicola]|uniref:Major facilitator superfamily (MFS) profile domain-containing protein n=1 Tax=Lactobacillus xylocopicola TaxID=2976676 RepID=A0ABM8BFJ7_9LACO|nr:MFS transporter [Lactobacillus xylocopicola]BDR60031.1 hypothetical protein KIM322_02920 [Lactobacillus xylocopicola]